MRDQKKDADAGSVDQDAQQRETKAARILQLAAEGLSNAAIAERLGISRASVKVVKSQNGIRSNPDFIRMLLPADLAQWLREDCPEGRPFYDHIIQCLEYTRSYSPPRKRRTK